MNSDLSVVVKHFRFAGEYIDINPHGFGHINDTYVARFQNPDGTVNRYILQRINHHVFKQPKGVMQNIEQVTDHLREKIIATDGDPIRETINLIPTLNGQTLHITSDGNYWRAEMYIEGAQAYQRAQSLDHHYNASRAFGKFQKMLGDFPTETLNITIPDFHNTPKRFRSFIEAVERDFINRARLVKSEIEFVLDRADETYVLIDLFERGELPERVTHNDSKFDNVMIDDETGEGICVIDLDTVMPGLSLYDFGDSVRFGANPATEDECDLSKVYIDMDVYDRIVAGFLETARDFLTTTEVDYLPFSAKLITLEQGIRFLSDYLNGDVYYKTHREGQNLDRCRTQLKMVDDMEMKMAQMEGIVERYR